MLDIILRIAYLSAIGLSLYTSGWLLVKANKDRTTGALILCQFLVIIWCIPQLFSAFPMTRGMKYFAYAVSYIGISFIGPAWLTFALLYSKKRPGRFLSLFLFGIAAVNYSILLTNEYHHLFYRRFEVEEVIYGPFFYFHMAYTYLCVLTGMAVVLKIFKKNHVAIQHIAAALLAAAVPLGFNLLYITGLVKSGFDLTPPAFAFSSVLMLLAVFRYDFLNVNILAFDTIIDSIAEGVAVYNRRGKITYSNGAVRKWFGLRTGDEAEILWKRLKEFGVILNENDMQTGPVVEPGIVKAEVRIEVKQNLYYDKKRRLLAGAVMFTDVEKYCQLLEQGKELAVSNQKLAIEQERNRIAQEVHDTAGHTLTMINSLLKLIRVEYEGGREARRAVCGENRTAEEQKCGADSQIEAYLSQAQTLAGEGIRELRCSINNLKQSASFGLITQGVYQLAQSVKEFQVEVAIQGEDREEYSFLSPVVYECLREAITNCLKYAKASHMDIILKFGDSCLNLYIFDNGIGCSDIRPGNGIAGIQSRVELAGGTARILSEPGSGFQIYIRLPLERV